MEANKCIRKFQDRMSICFGIVMAVVSVAAFYLSVFRYGFIGLIKTNNVLRNYFGSVIPDRTFLF